VRLLVHQGDRLEINEPGGSDEETALCIAIRLERLDIMDTLLKHSRINLDIMNRWGETASILAVKQGHTAMVGRLIQGPTIPCNMALAADLASSQEPRGGIPYQGETEGEINGEEQQQLFDQAVPTSATSKRCGICTCLTTSGLKSLVGFISYFVWFLISLRNDVCPQGISHCFLLFTHLH
jgi:hypothetical protein